MKVLVYTLIFILCTSLVFPFYTTPASAGPEDILWSEARPYRAISPLIPESGMNFLAPVSKPFSGSAQMVVRGEDVRFANAKKGAIEDWMEKNIDFGNSFPGSEIPG